PGTHRCDGAHRGRLVPWATPEETVFASPMLRRHRCLESTRALHRHQHHLTTLDMSTRQGTKPNASVYRRVNVRKQMKWQTTTRLLQRSLGPGEVIEAEWAQPHRSLHSWVIPQSRK